MILSSEGVGIRAQGWLKLSTCFDCVVYNYCHDEVGAGPTGPSATGAFSHGDKLWELPQ